MGGNRQNFRPNPKKENAKLQEERAKALLEEKKAKDKKMLIIRICIAAAVFITAVVLCVLMLKHDFNADRKPLLGTYTAQDRYIYTSASGSDISDVKETFAITFYEDGRMMYKRESGFGIHYFEFSKEAAEPYDGVITRYTDGMPGGEINITREENGDMMLYYTEDSVSFTIPELVRCYGEEMTKSMMIGLYDEEICTLLIAGDYDSITDDQLKVIGVERKKLPDIAFSIKDLPVILTLTKVSDVPLTREQALEIWGEKTGASADEAASDSDTASDADTDAQ